MPPDTAATTSGASPPATALILAAGGVVWSGRWPRRRVLVIRRRRYAHERGWTLPKGKVEPGETAAAAAVREVREETGCTARPLEFAGTVRYLVAGVPKLVLYWAMEAAETPPFVANDEVVEVAWLGPRAALRALHYPGERKLLARVVRA
jgi:8-oxo-dGTP diphosphatase